MKIKYSGSRQSVSTCCSGRMTYYFGQENAFTNEVLSERHAQELLSSKLHKFEVVMEAPIVMKPTPSIPKEPVAKPVIKEEKVKVEQPKKRGRKKKNG